MTFIFGNWHDHLLLSVLDVAVIEEKFRLESALRLLLLKFDFQRRLILSRLSVLAFVIEHVVN